MAGYNRSAWKSNNAVQAEQMGMKTASALASVIKKKVRARDVEEVFEAVAWHHTSGRFNRTLYYWEPVIEVLATCPSITDEELRERIGNDLVNVLKLAQDSRDYTTVSDLQAIVDNEVAFRNHVEQKRKALGNVYDRARQHASAGKNVDVVIANVSYTEFSYSRRLGRYKVVDEVILRAVPVTIKGDWATFSKDGQKIRKKISSSAFDIEIIEKPTQVRASIAEAGA